MLLKSKFLAFLPTMLAVHNRVDSKTRFLNAESFKSSKFVVLADPQLGMLDSYEPSELKRQQLGISGSRKNGSLFQNELALVNQTVTYINKYNVQHTEENKIEFVVILGDMVNQYPSGAIQKSYSDARMHEFAIVNRQQVAGLKSVLSGSKVPVFVLPGNHDVGDDFYDEAVDNYVAQWGADYYYFDVEDSLFLFLNTQIWKNEEKTSQKKKGEMNDFIDNVFDKFGSQGGAETSKIKNLHIFQHFPMFWNQKNRASLDADDMVDEKTKIDLMKKIQRSFPGVSLKIYAGHLHGQDIFSDCGTQLIVNSLTSNKDDGGWQFGKYGGVHIVNDTSTSEFVGLDEM